VLYWMRHFVAEIAENHDGERPGPWNWIQPKSTSGIPGGLRISTVYVNLLSRKILIQFRSNGSNERQFYALITFLFLVV
jgi:hypothetical protein